MFVFCRKLSALAAANQSIWNAFNDSDLNNERNAICAFGLFLRSWTVSVETYWSEARIRQPLPQMGWLKQKRPLTRSGSKS